MKINNKTFPLVPLLLLFAIIYLFLAVKPLNTAMQLIPQWTIDITEPQSKLTSSEKLLPFKLGKNMGYYTPDGLIAFLHPFEQKAAISSSYWAEFSLDAEHTPFFDATDKQIGVLEDAGFPFFEDDRIFLLHPGGNSFSAYESDGSKKWTYEDYVPITSFSSTPSGSIAGFADGKLVAFNSEGTIIQKFYPGGSNYQMIFGAALSQSGEYSACVSGLEAQRIVISHIGENQNKVIFHEYLEADIIEQTLVQFSSDDRYAFFNTKTELIIVDINKKSSTRIPMDGTVLTITELDDDNTYFVLSKKQDKYTVTILTDGNSKMGSFSFNGDSAFLYSDNNDVYIGYDTYISKITVIH